MNDRRTNYGLCFGLELQKMLVARGIGQLDLDRKIRRLGLRMERNIESLIINKFTPSPNDVNFIAMALDLAGDEKMKLHRAAALDVGYEIGVLE